jgi:hypothetical protein
LLIHFCVKLIKDDPQQGEIIARFINVSPFSSNKRVGVAGSRGGIRFTYPPHRIASLWGGNM